jgi:TolB protein
MNADGTNVTRLTDRECQSHDPIWSPDGTKIAYICGLDEYQDIFVMNADGSNLVRITHNEVPDNAPNWSPDSTLLTYVHYLNRQETDSEIFVANVITAQRTQITNNSYADYSPVWSPDGSLIVFSTYLDGSYEIATMNPDGSNITNLTNSASGIRDNLPRWSSDGTKISFISERDGDPGYKELWIMDADGSNQMELDDRVSNDSPVQRWNPHPAVP